MTGKALFSMILLLSISLFTSAMALSWSSVSSYGNISSNSFCHTVSGPNTKPLLSDLWA